MRIYRIMDGIMYILYISHPGGGPAPKVGTLIPSNDVLEPKGAMHIAS